MKAATATRAALAVTLAAALCLACATTTFVSTWKSPEAQPLRLTGARVVAIFVTNSPERRRRAEDALAREINQRGAHGVPSYTILSETEVRDEDASRTKLEQAGYQGAVVMRVVGRETQYTYEPGYWNGHPYYQHFWHGGYWGWGWGHVYEPGYLHEDRVVSVETLVYSFKQDQLVWAGVSKTVDPTQLDSFISELADAVTKQMEKDGLLPKGA
jgi:hypothetical protein